MRLNYSQTYALTQVLDLFRQIGRDQASLIAETDGRVVAADLSRAKYKGYVPEKKWDLILETMLRIADTARKAARKDKNSRHETIANEICGLVEKKVRRMEGTAIETVDIGSLDGEELRLAALARRCNESLNPDVWSATTPSSIYTVRVPYPADPPVGDPEFSRRLIGDNWRRELEAIAQLRIQLEVFQAKMRAVVLDANGPSGECRVRHKDESEFRGLLSGARIKTTALVYLIPFFYTADRRFDYGVVRYGVHRHLGMLVSKATLRGTLGSEIDVMERRDFVKFLDPELKMKIHHVDPYSAEHILCQMLLESQDESLLDRFNDANNPPEVNLAAAAAALAKYPETTLFVFDLADQFALVEALRKDPNASVFADHKILRLRHELEIQVGLGYSLRAFDWIVERDRLKSWHRKAFELIQGSRSHLERAGIEIDAPKEQRKKQTTKG